MNIFARELVLILGAHDKELSNLFRLPVQRSYVGDPETIPPSKVTRLKRSLSEDITATLNADELDALQDWVPLDEDGEEMRRLRAALVAEAVRFLLAGRVSQQQATALGEVTLALLLGTDERQFATLRDQLLDSVRGVRGGVHGGGSVERAALRGVLDDRAGNEGQVDAAPTDDEVERALDPAMEAYEQGTLWLEVARDTTDRGARRGYVALAESLLTRARELAEKAPNVAQGTPQQTDLLASLAAALTSAGELH